MYVREISMKEETFSRRRRNPSFSSSLLDSIYRSIDESNGGDGDRGYVRESSMMKKQSSCAKGGNERTNLRRAIMIENWVEKQSVHSSMFTNSGSSSSESSSGAAFSSSETDSSYKSRSKLKPVIVPTHSENYMQFEEKAKSESSAAGGLGFTKTTKLRALKIYGELKKVKQPISPGGRIVSFINSIFNYGNVKKAKMCYVGAVEDVSTSENIPNTKSSCSTSTSASASAAAFSRSCLSKRPKKSISGTKRSVRFYPVSVILGEEGTQPSSYHKCAYEEDPILMPKPSFQKYARTSTSLLKEDLATVVGQNFVRGFCDNADDDDESDHDARSYSSSDLFELDHPVGIGRYREELPVYETTNFRTNQAIAKGLIL